MDTIIHLAYILIFVGIHPTQAVTDVLYSASFPADDRFAPPIGNGYLATNVLSDTIYMNGVFNGYLDDSHRARVPSTASIGIHFDDDEDVRREFSLDMKKALFQQSVFHPNCNISLRYFAHREFHTLLVTLVDVRWREGAGPSTVKLTLNHGNASNDIDLKETSLTSTTSFRSGQIFQPETNDSDRTWVYHYFDNVDTSSVVQRAPGSEVTELTFITSISINISVAEKEFFKAKMTSRDNLLQTHVQASERLWLQGRIVIHGNDELQRNINACFYHILCSVPLKEESYSPFKGISPGGLSRGGKINPNKRGGPSNDYAGHVFWDMDTWVMPPIMMFHPDVAEMMISTRLGVLDRVRMNAQKSGYKGMKFPWEQGISGAETCPWQPASDFEIHVTADVSYALRQYMYVSNDVAAKRILTKNGTNLAMGIARFWSSRVTKNHEAKYEINGVMGPDEYHFNINNSVFTNYNAKLSLQLPQYINRRFPRTIENVTEVDHFSTVADNMVILYDKEMKYHPQFQGFTLNDTVKQSDVVLLGFPLLMPMSRDIRRNDIQLYEKVTDRYGPDTGTWSMHTVGWLELGDERKAEKNFKRMFRNINGPFKVFSEKPASSKDGPRCVNFITLAGGLLQSVVFGYGGVRLYPEYMLIHPYLLPNTTWWSMKGLHYKGHVLDIDISSHHLVFRLQPGPSDDKQGDLFIRRKDGKNFVLTTKPLRLERGPLRLYAQHRESRDTNNAICFVNDFSKYFSLVLFISYISYNFNP